MAGKQQVQTIVIPVEFKAAANAYGQIVKQMEQSLSKVDVNSAVGKRLATSLRNAQYKQQQLTNLVAGDEFNVKDMNKAVSLMGQLETVANKVQYDFQHINVKELTLTSEQLASWNKASKAITQYSNQLVVARENAAKANKEMFAGGDVKGAIKKMGVEETPEMTKKIEEYEKLRQKAEEVQKQILETESAYKAATEKLSKMNTPQKEKEIGGKAIQKAMSARATDSTAAMKMYAALAEQGATADSVFEKTFSDVFQKSKDGSLTGKFKAGGKDIANLYLSSLGLDEAQIQTIIETAGSRVEAIQKAISEKLGNIPQELANKASTQQKDIAAKAFSDYLAPVQEAVAQAQKTDWSKSMQAHKLEKGMASSQDEILAQVNAALEQRVVSLESQLAKAQRDITTLEQELRNQNGLRNGNFGAQARQATNTGTEGREKVEAGLRAEAEMSAAEQETQQFQDRLQASIKRWMGFTQVINIVRGGIRQAYNDIQALDKTITNMAVVTDMSISELWGKINEYMSVAQQYGVTTQGVYEVMQLYSQQGLGLSESMQMTTETLKMARQWPICK